MARLILDTGVLIAGMRGTMPANALPEEDDIAVPAIVVAEYLAGIHNDRDPRRQAAQRAYLDELLAVSPVCEYDQSVAEVHAELLAYVRRTGTPRGPHDLIIAATSRSTGRMLVTTDERARFHELPEVQVQLVSVAPR